MSRKSKVFYTATLDPTASDPGEPYEHEFVPEEDDESPEPDINYDDYL